MGLSGETVGSDLLKSDSVKSRLWWLKNKVWRVKIVNISTQVQETEEELALTKVPSEIMLNNGTLSAVA